MPTIKRSRQRDAILNFLISRKDHPTAETVYTHLRQTMPNISLGTVYRNLSLLVELGQAIRVPSPDGLDHYDGCTDLHYHFACRCCNSITDLDMPDLSLINEIAAKSFSGTIEGHTTYFYGVCEKCTNIFKNDIDNQVTVC